MFAVITPVLFAVALAAPQASDATVAKDSLSVHHVQRGTMPLREGGVGTVTSISPATVSITLSPRQSELVRPGQKCSVQVLAPAVSAGTVARITRSGNPETIAAEIELVGSLPPATSVGANVGALIDVGEATDIVFLERPADARPDTTSTIFVLEADGEHARRVPVRYGRQSGALMEILSGLAPGDRVIVTDMSGSAGQNRVRLK